MPVEGFDEPFQPDLQARFFMNHRGRDEAKAQPEGIPTGNHALDIMCLPSHCSARLQSELEPASTATSDEHAQSLEKSSLLSNHRSRVVV